MLVFGGVFIVMVSMVVMVLVLVGVWYGSEGHHVCYVPIKAIFCECNNSIVEAIVFSFSLVWLCVWLISRYSRFFRGNVGSC